MRTKEGVKPFKSWQFPEFNKDTEQIWWKGTTGSIPKRSFPSKPRPTIRYAMLAQESFNRESRS